MEKEVFFAKLYALRDNSDEEEDTSDARRILRRSRKKLETPSILVEATPEKQPHVIKRFPNLPRSNSDPVVATSFVKETPPMARKSLLSRSEILASTGMEAHAMEKTPPHGSDPVASPRLNLESAGTPGPRLTSSGESRPSTERRTVSDPMVLRSTIGSNLTLTNSYGITKMLGKKRVGPGAGGVVPPKKKAKREPALKLLPEADRFLANIIFYYVPPDDNNPLRKIRIRKARERGAEWTRELIPAVTHIIVDKSSTYTDVLTVLKVDQIPTDVILVKDSYFIDCISDSFLHDPFQKRYEVCVRKQTLNINKSPVQESHTSNVSLQLKWKKTRKEQEEEEAARQTPPRDSGPDYSQSGLGDIPLVKPALQGNKNGEAADVSRQGAENSTNEVSDDAEYNAEFREIIKEAQIMKNLNMNEDEDSESTQAPFGDEDTGSGTESDSYQPATRRSSKLKQNKFSKGGLKQDAFVCMTGGTGETPSTNPNTPTIDILQQMADIYERNKDQWRVNAYRRAIGQLKKQTMKIATYEQAFALPMVGDRLAKKIEEIALTNRLRRLDNALQEPGDATLQTFTKIYGVGKQQGWKWVQQGYKSLEDLKANATLSENQKMGIEHYDDLQTRIPRDEVTALGEVVKTAASKLDPEIEVILGGSYRRGALDSGDIDCLITRAGTTSEADLLPFLRTLISHLTSTDFLVFAVAEPSDTGSKWHGCCVLPNSHGTWRRIDFLLVPQTQLGAALIYFTGDDLFNRSMRLLASRKGMKLNQRGLFGDVMRGPRRVKLTEGRLLEAESEKGIFARLGVPWREPWDRICH